MHRGAIWLSLLHTADKIWQIYCKGVAALWDLWWSVRFCEHAIALIAQRILEVLSLTLSVTSCAAWGSSNEHEGSPSKHVRRAGVMVTLFFSPRWVWQLQYPECYLLHLTTIFRWCGFLPNLRSKSYRPSEDLSKSVRRRKYEKNGMSFQSTSSAYIPSLLLCEWLQVWNTIQQISGNMFFWKSHVSGDAFPANGSHLRCTIITMPAQVFSVWVPETYRI